MRGIAFDPATSHLFVINPAEQKLYELSQDGQLTATRDLAEFGLKNPQGMVFAPSGDQTDESSQTSLYVANGGSSLTRSQAAPKAKLRLTQQAQSTTDGQIVELSLAAIVAPEAVNFTSTLIRTTDLAAISPPSPDPSGITYLPNSIIPCWLWMEKWKRRLAASHTSRAPTYGN